MLDELYGPLPGPEEQEINRLETDNRDRGSGLDVLHHEWERSHALGGVKPCRRQRLSARWELRGCTNTCTANTACTSSCTGGTAASGLRYDGNREANPEEENGGDVG